MLEADSSTIKLTIIGSSGQHYQVQGNEGWSLVETIQKNNLQGEFQDFGVCFGTSFCRTCHMYFKPEDFNKIPKLDEDSDEKFYLEEIPNYIPGS
ncbi:hypothetical protein AVEN_104446-1 [Araneus ventricosus]|uniref:Uncharacterized protein n=1 Tax=Araneus ventricosus TaxID=182803 RepID=A0A4Y2UAQ1_ARAVE|nr:hypothetical protein AVEN_104446-1 [Araneus ventricosus]